MKIDLGKVAVTAAGNWSQARSYEALTMVVNDAQTGGDGCGYISLKNNIGVRPGTDETVWMKAVEAGTSIYQLCVKHGTFDGTEEEFVEAYNAAVLAAKDAAENAAKTEAEIKQAETGRARAEVERGENEGARIKAERDRAAAEEARENAETGRADNEEERARVFARQSSAMSAALENADEATLKASDAAGAANAAAVYAKDTAETAAKHAEEAAETTKEMNAGLIGLKVEDGELILVQNAETGTVTGGEIDDNGMVNIEFEV